MKALCPMRRNDPPGLDSWDHVDKGLKGSRATLIGGHVKLFIRFLVLSVVAAMAACATPQNVQFSDEGKGGEVEVNLTEPMQNVNVMIDGRPVVRQAFTQAITVSGIPVGERRIQVVASEWSRSEDINFDEIREITGSEREYITIATPNRSGAWWAMQIVTTALAVSIAASGP